jgi:hypothetical protein
MFQNVVHSKWRQIINGIKLKHQNSLGINVDIHIPVFVGPRLLGLRSDILIQVWTIMMVMQSSWPVSPVDHVYFSLAYRVYSFRATLAWSHNRLVPCYGDRLPLPHQPLKSLTEEPQSKLTLCDTRSKAATIIQMPCCMSVTVKLIGHMAPTLLFLL